jgi:flagellar protein FliL
VALQKAPSAEDKSTDEAAAAKGGKSKLMMLGAILVLVGVVAYLMFLKPSSGGTKAAPPPPEPGVVLSMEPLTLNLAGGHFLKLGMALQFTKDGVPAEGKPDGSKAADAAINLMSNREVAELSSNKARNELKKQLIDRVEKAYEDEKTKKSAVMDIYLTEFVMQ